MNFGFYSKKEPSVQLFLNGEPLSTAKQSQDRSLVQHKHPAGNVTGLTLVDFIALPARARLSIAYLGETYGEGFMSLRKL